MDGGGIVEKGEIRIKSEKKTINIYFLRLWYFGIFPSRYTCTVNAQRAGDAGLEGRLKFNVYKWLRPFCSVRWKSVGQIIQSRRDGLREKSYSWSSVDPIHKRASIPPYLTADFETFCKQMTARMRGDILPEVSSLKVIVQEWKDKEEKKTIDSSRGVGIDVRQEEARISVRVLGDVLAKIEELENS